MDAATNEAQAKPVAALAYLLGFVTGIILLYLEPFNRDEFIRFHARQSIGFSIAWFAINVILGVFISVVPAQVGMVFGFLQSLVNLVIAIFWVFLMYKAYTGERYRIPQLADIVDNVASSVSL